MNTRLAKYLLALTAGILVWDASGQALAPNAEILLARQAAGQKPMRISGADKKAEPVSQTSVSAYIYVDDKAALTTLEEIGVTIRRDYGDFATASIPVDILRQAGEVEGVKYISLGNNVNLLNDYVRDHTLVDDIHDNTGNQLPRPYTGKGIVVGIIDSGVEYGHLAFRDPDDGQTLRIKAVWTQLTNYGGTAPEKFGYGIEMREPSLILSKTYDTSTTFHGSHTMGTAAGSDMTSEYYGVAPEADIVFVSFKNDDACIADAIQYIFDYADEVDKPCVINMSLGEHTGPHNGTSTLDRHIDSLTGPGRIIVGACGNEAEYRLHATETFTEEDTQLKTMLTFAKGVSHNLHYLDIWGSEGTNFSAKLCVAHALKGNITYRSPAIDTADPDKKTVIHAFDIEETGVTGTIILRSEINPLNGQPHVMVECTIEEIADGRVPGIIIDGQPGQRVDLWNYGSHEFSSNGKSGWTDGTISGTVGEIGGTAHTIIPVGSYDARDRIYWTSGGYSIWAENFPYEADARSIFSSCGPTADDRVVPAVLAPGNPVVSAINRYAYEAMGFDLFYMTTGVSTRPDGVKSYYSYSSGTSMAAPVVTGTVALMLEANPNLTPAQAKEIIQRTAMTGDYMGQLPNNEYGAGLLNSLACVKEAVALSGITPTAEDISAEASIKVWKEGQSLMVAIPSISGTAVMTVTDTTGRTVATSELTAPLTSLDCSGWGNGVFIVTVSTGSNRHSYKVAL